MGERGERTLYSQTERGKGESKQRLSALSAPTRPRVGFGLTSQSAASELRGVKEQERPLHLLALYFECRHLCVCTHTSVSGCMGRVEERMMCCKNNNRHRHTDKSNSRHTLFPSSCISREAEKKTVSGRREKRATCEGNYLRGRDTRTAS